MRMELPRSATPNLRGRAAAAAAIRAVSLDEQAVQAIQYMWSITSPVLMSVRRL
jgi:hypothetical protein